MDSAKVRKQIYLVGDSEWKKGNITANVHKYREDENNTLVHKALSQKVEDLEQQAKDISQTPPEYITMIVENLNQLNASIREMASGFYGSSNGGGGGGMDDLKRRVNDLDNKICKVEEKLYTIDKTLAIVEERTKKIDSLPSEDRMRSIIQEAFKDKDPASKEFVQNTVSTSETAMIKWQTKTAISIVALTSAIIFGILKYLLP